MNEKRILAIDLGGTAAKAGLVVGGAITKRWVIPTNKADIFGEIKRGLTDLPPTAFDLIGLAMPGFIDHERMIVKFAGNLGLQDFDIRQEFKRHFDHQVFILNDANAAVLGEFWKGAAQNDKSTIIYTIGTGIGGGIIVNGHLVTGHDGYAGEFGHGGNFQHKYQCNCQLHGCIEPVASVSGIKRLLAEKIGNISFKEASEQFMNGDAQMQAIFTEALTPLAFHITVMQTALNPDSIIIGGGLSALGEPLRKLLTTIVAANQLPFIAKSSPIKIATTFNDAGMYGAAYWALTESAK